MISIFILYALFGSTFTIGKEAIAHIPPIFFIGLRMILAGILLIGFVKFYQKKSVRIKSKDLILVGLVAFFQFYLSFVLEFVALDYLPSSKVALLYNTSPFITAFLSYLFFSEVMTFRKWIGLIASFLAFIPLIMETADGKELALGAIGSFSIPEILLLTAVVASCLGWIAMRPLTRDHSNSYILINGVAMLWGGVLALGTAFFYEPIPSLESLVSTPVLISMGLLILIGNVICFNLYSKLLRTYSPTLLSFFGFFAPLFTALFSWWWFGEHISPAFYQTTILVIISSYFFYQEELKQGYIL